MVLRYNIPAAIEVFKDPEKVLKHIERLHNKTLQREDYKVIQKGLASFVLTSKGLFCYNIYLDGKILRKVSAADKILYLYLAGKRDYFDYVSKNKTQLPIYLSDISKEKIVNNPLLDIKNDVIHFKLEQYHSSGITKEK